MDASRRRWLFATLAARELRGGIGGFRIFLACLALGVAAIAAVQSLSAALIEGIRQDGRALLGGDVAVRQVYQPPDMDVMAELRAAGRIAETAEMRAMARAGDDRPATAPAVQAAVQAAVLVELKAVDEAYPLVGRVQLTDGGELAAALARSDGRWGAVIEPALARRLHLAQGDRFRLGEGVFRLGGLLASEPDKASAGAFSLGPRVMIATSALPATGLVQPGSLITWTERLALAPGTDAGAWIAGLKTRFPQAPWRVRGSEDAAPQLASFIDRMGLFLTLVGLAALLVGGLGVANAVHAHLEARRHTIATLKCLGASGDLIVAIYLAQVLALAGLGILIGLAAGATAPWLLKMALSGLLPIAPQGLFHAKALVTAAAFGLLTALAFSLWPLGRTRQVPGAALFRQIVAPTAVWPPLAYQVATLAAGAALAALAIASAGKPAFAAWFVAGAVATLVVFKGAALAVTGGAARIRHLRRPSVRLAVANLHRPGNPTGSIMLSLGVGLTVLIAVALIESNFSRRLLEEIPHEAPSFFFIDIQPDQLEPLRRAVLAVPGAERFEAVPSLRGRIVSVDGRDAASALVDRERAWIVEGERGLTYAATPPAHSPILDGQWWPEDYQGPPLVSIHKEVAEAFAIGPGHRIAVDVLGRTLEATVASVRGGNFSSMNINFTLVFAPGALDGAPKSFLATVRTPTAGEDEVQRALSSAFPNVSLLRVKDALDAATTLLGQIGTAVRLIGAVTLGAGVLVLAGAILADHRRRVADSVILKVLGATRARIATIFLVEYGLLGLITAAVASLAGTAAAWAVMTFVMRWDWSFEPMAVLTTGALGLAITLGAGLAGTWRALGQAPARWLRHE